MPCSFYGPFFKSHLTYRSSPICMTLEFYLVKGRSELRPPEIWRCYNSTRNVSDNLKMGPTLSFSEKLERALISVSMLVTKRSEQGSYTKPNKLVCHGSQKNLEDFCGCDLSWQVKNPYTSHWIRSQAKPPNPTSVRGHRRRGHIDNTTHTCNYLLLSWLCGSLENMRKVSIGWSTEI